MDDPLRRNYEGRLRGGRGAVEAGRGGRGEPEYGGAPTGHAGGHRGGNGGRGLDHSRDRASGLQATHPFEDATRGREGRRRRRGRRDRRPQQNEALHAGAGDRCQREIGFRKLEELANDDGLKIMQKISDSQTLTMFCEMMAHKSLNPDWIRLIVKILAKLCQVEYRPIIVLLFHKVCQQEFLNQLLLHIVTVSADKQNRPISLSEFFENFCTFSRGMLKLIPVLAVEKLQIHVQKATVELSDLSSESFVKIRQELDLIAVKMKLEEERKEGERSSKRQRIERDLHDSQDPPDNFREISTYPTLDDVYDQRPFIRKNIIKGPYISVDHYLDVNFRLLREDYVRPVREGIQEYKRRVLEMGTETNRKIRIDNFRIYEKVMFTTFKTEEEKTVLELCFDPEKKMAGKINWDTAKRLMAGSLLVLTRDISFSSWTLATVSNKRDMKMLELGFVFVELCQGVGVKDLLVGHFLMMECAIFFGAYAPVLEALQTLNETNFPMKEYLVEGRNDHVRPEYLHEHDGPLILSVPLASGDAASIENSFSIVMEDDISNWPSLATMGLDESQYRGIRASLTNKIMLIQGPPGTGKTFLGLKVAAAMVLNKGLWNSTKPPRPMLIVCYTNHALDQFLLGIMSATERIVRVGGRCKEEKLEQFCIKALKKKKLKNAHNLYRMLYESREKFLKIKVIYEGVNNCISQIKRNAGILDLKTLCLFNVLSKEHYHRFQNLSIMKWLCEDCDERVFGIDPQKGNPLSALILDMSHWDFQYLEGLAGSESDSEKQVWFFLSCEKLKDLKSTSGSEVVSQAVERVLGIIEREMENHEVDQGNLNLVNMRFQGGLGFLNHRERWQLYRFWKERLINILKRKLNGIEPIFVEAATQFKEWRMVEEQTIMANNLVVGMTTSYAAAHQRILRQLKPRVVIVEEAAEIFEAHVLVSLTSEVDHLILIGDHQQLRPKPAVHDLAIRYHLDVSMFERLLNNGVNCVSLTTQHRMRPEVAKLICPAIYANLINHTSVSAFPNVRGVTKNVFFLDHTHHEEEVKDALSHQNSFEGMFLSSLVRYLLLQGYDPSKITILSTYKGQQFFFTKLRSEAPHLKDVKSTVVDNFQGEENDIIVLSLVRSNPNDSVGFLKTENRVCVALSRARHGLFIVGNMTNMTAKDTVWRKVRDELSKQNAIGPKLQLRCEVHGTITSVGAAEDFANCPQGGCLRQCELLLPCSHLCQQVCHTSDREHEHIKCTERCIKELCPRKHICPDLCYQQCKPCKAPKTEMLVCGHTATMPCYREPLEHKCQAAIMCKLPICGHESDAKCYQKAALETVACKDKCEVRLDCGHSCEKTCHVFQDPTHEKYLCMKPCGQKKVYCSREHYCNKVCHEACEACSVQVEKMLPCGHKLKMPCKDDVAIAVCRKKCERTLECGHKCRKTCYKPCHPCPTKVMKVVPACGHSQKMACGLDPESYHECSNRCERRLASCGHPCPLTCGASCELAKCEELVQFEGNASCQHQIMIPCHMRSSFASGDDPLLLSFCKEPCRKKLERCEHPCMGSCGSCWQGRFHVACRSKCERPQICGHSCKAPCAVSCPPCTQQCTMRCTHSKCKRRCGEPCEPCKERCEQQCTHQSCDAPCGQLCEKEACSEPCNKKIDTCGHVCIGLCGDTCICRECNQGKIDEFPGFGMEDDENSRFVYLTDCQHIIESSGLDVWMRGSQDGDAEIIVKGCPQCKTPVRTCKRYLNIIKKNAAEVAAVKLKLYGNWNNIYPLLKDTQTRLDNLPAFPAGFSSAESLKKALSTPLQEVESKYQRRNRGARNVPPRSLTEVQSLAEYTGIISNLSDIINDVYLGKDTNKLSLASATEIRDFVEKLCSELSRRDLFRLGEQEASDINVELKRLQRLVGVCQLQSSPNSKFLDRPLKESLAALFEVVRSPFRFEDREGMDEKIRVLALILKTFISAKEKLQVRAAMGFSPGHWYKCSNGHPYCVGECGAARQQGRCPECGVLIGAGVLATPEVD